MNCQQIDQILLQAQKNEIPTQVQHEIEKHLEECVSCRINVYLTQLEDDVLTEPAAVPLIRSDFIQRTMQLLPQEQYGQTPQVSSSSTKKKTAKSHRIWMGTAASLLLLVGAGFYFRENLASFLSFEGSNQASNLSIVAEQPAESNDSLAAKTSSLDNLNEQQNDVFYAEDLEESMDPVMASAINETIPNERMSITEEESISPSMDSVTMTPAAYDLQSSSDDENESETLSNPYQYAPASAYVSSVETYYQTSRSSGAEVSKTSSSQIPDIVLSSLPEHFRLVDFSCQESFYTFLYQDDLSNLELLFTATPYDSSSSFIDLPNDSIAYRLIACGDITYQVTLEGSCMESDLVRILEEIEIDRQP